MSPMPQQSYKLMLADPWTLDDFTDISSLVRGWSGTVMGRQHELQLFQPGRVAIDLTNRDGCFNTWNTQGPFYNLLTAGDASAETADGTLNTAPVVSNWLAGTATGCAIAVAPPPVIIDGPTAYSLTATTTAMSVLMPNNYYAVVAGNYYSIMCSFLAGSVARSCQIVAKWYTSGGAHIGGADVNASVTDATSAWAKASLLGTQAPATAAFVALEVLLPTTANTEVHWFSRAALFNYDPRIVNTAWGPGQRGLVPGRPIKASATWASVPYPVFSMFVSNWTPVYGQVSSDITINCTDALGLLALGDLSSSAYAAQVLLDGATSLWRLGDAVASTIYAADSGPNNFPIYAPQVAFGQASPILTDDTTVAAFQAPGAQGSLAGTAPMAPAVGAQSLEILFQIPPGQKTINQLFYSANTSGVAFHPTTNQVQVTCNGGSAGPSNFYITNKLIANGAWHHLVVACSAATNGTIATFLDGTLIGLVHVTGGNSSCLFDTSSAFWFGVLNTGDYGFAGQMADLAVYGSTYLTAGTVGHHYALFSAGFTVQYSGQRIAAMLAVLGWPAALQSIATGVQMVQGATSGLTQTAALSYLQSVEQSEMGALFVNQAGVLTFYDRHYILTAPAATVSNGLFSSSGADVGAYRYESAPPVVPVKDDLDLWNDIPTQRIGGVLQRTRNTLSIKQYRQRTLVGFTGELQTDDVDVLSQGQWLSEHYSEPVERIRTITLTSVPDAGANLPQMLGRGIFDLVEVKWKPLDGTIVVFDQPSLIEQVAHKVTPQKWETTWQLSPQDTQEYMILNDSVLGQLSTDNRLAY